MVPSTRKVAASTRPGAGDDAAGGGEGDQRALAGAEVHRLLAHPGHQEDVVVDAQGHQEHEGEQREAGIGPGEAEDVLEQHAEMPSAAPKDSTTVAIRISGASDRAQQGHQDQEHQRAG